MLTGWWNSASGGREPPDSWRRRIRGLTPPARQEFSHHDLVAPFALGLVELLVGLAEEFVRGQRVVALGGGNAHADGHLVDLPLVLEEVAFDQLANALGDL